MRIPARTLLAPSRVDFGCGIHQVGNRIVPSLGSLPAELWL